MTSNNSAMSFDEVLEQFMMEDRHDGDVLERYVRAHPLFAARLIDLSRLIATPGADDEGPLSAIDESRIDASWIAYSAVAAGDAPKEDPFAALTGERGKAMSVALGVPRQVITCFRERRVDPSSVPAPILRRFSEEFELPMAHVIAAMRLPAPASSGRSFKADGKPGVAGQISFEQVLIDAGVSDTDRALLLADG